ncbi:uncharacterized protein LOC136762816 [Amia ocellicauda]|uniref:uncharacterized protein LOC136762816 n=1 Tax=Amia ocellicauda TaxID=2972642 RepID=UPI003463F796
MVFNIFLTVVHWTFRGFICFSRFVWVNPFQAIAAPPARKESNITRVTRHSLRQEKHETGISGEKSNRHDFSNLVCKRLSKAEGDIQLLKTQIVNEKMLWERKFLELQRKQQELREQLSSEISAVEQEGNGSGAGNLSESERADYESYVKEDQDVFSSGVLLPNRHEKIVAMPMKSSRRSDVSTDSLCHLSGSPLSLSSVYSSRRSSAASSNTRLRSLRNHSTPHRVFVPHSHLDLQIGHRVRVLMPSGRISTGTIQYLGYLSGMQDFCLGVELETAECGQHNGVYQGHCYFQCKPGHGAFVNFNKLLMVWE